MKPRMDPFRIDSETFNGLEGKTQNWTARDWQEVKRLIAYRGRLASATKQLLEDLTTDQLIAVYELVRDQHANTHPNASDEWQDDELVRRQEMQLEQYEREERRPNHQ